MAERVLIIEDEEDIRENLAFSLKREGFEALEAASGEQGLELARSGKPAIILLDLMLPGMDGLSVCRHLKQAASTAAIPIIMLTAKGEEIDKIVGFELGADDYVVKPFSLREVVLRIRAVLRRGREETYTSEVNSGALTLDAVRHQAWAGDRELDLTLSEFKLLQNLLQHAGQVRSREQLLDAVWGYSFEGYARSVDSHIKRLRAKLGPHGELIETVRGIGYRVKSKS
ncbi:MAG: response regulator [Desulfovibrionaceae bacterium]|nr:response regulator [Desulfovibrionaceae bacterium]